MRPPPWATLASGRWHARRWPAISTPCALLRHVALGQLTAIGVYQRSPSIFARKMSWLSPYQDASLSAPEGICGLSRGLLAADLASPRVLGQRSGRSMPGRGGRWLLLRMVTIRAGGGIHETACRSHRHCIALLVLQPGVPTVLDRTARSLPARSFRNRGPNVRRQSELRHGAVAQRTPKPTRPAHWKLPSARPMLPSHNPVRTNQPEALQQAS